LKFNLETKDEEDQIKKFNHLDKRGSNTMSRNIILKASANTRRPNNSLSHIILEILKNTPRRPNNSFKLISYRKYKKYTPYTSCVNANLSLEAT
jgi:hypothetical protein